MITASVSGGSGTGSSASVRQSINTACPSTPAAEIMLQRALLWSFLTACLIGFAEWPFAHGVGQLILVVAALGYARSRPVALR